MAASSRAPEGQKLTEVQQGSSDAQKGFMVWPTSAMTDAMELDHALNPRAGLETKRLSEDAALPLGDLPNWQQETVFLG